MVQSLIKTARVSWNTTLLGILAGLALITPQVQALFDGNIETVADWNVVAEAIFIILLGAKARDGEKSTEKHNENKN